MSASKESISKVKQGVVEPQVEQPADLDEQRMDFTSETQIGILALMLSQPQRLGAGLRDLKGRCFDNPEVQRLVALYQDHLAKYAEPPTIEQMEEAIRQRWEGREDYPIYTEVFGRILSRVASITAAELSWTADEVTDWLRRKVAKGLSEQVEKLVSKKTTSGDDAITALQRGLEHIQNIGNTKKGGLAFMSASTRTKRVTQWVWKDVIAAGSLTVIVGDPSCGKSITTDYIASLVSSGTTWPDGAVNEKGRVLFIQGEDDWETVIQWRLEQYGADLELVEEILGYEDPRGGERVFSIDQDLALLKEALLVRPDTRLIIIDPIQSYYSASGGKNFNVDTVLRPILLKLSRFAKETGVAILAVTHLNKQTEAAGNPMYRVGGALTMVAVARMVWLMGWDQDAHGFRYLQRMKDSRKAGLKGMTFQIVPDDDPERGLRGGDFIWRPDIRVPALADLLRMGEGDKRCELKSWLRAQLSAGPAAALALYAGAKEAHGVSEQTVRKALHEIGAVSAGGGGTPYAWRL